jgi:acetolactate synthase-1/2/3 large subunit
VHVDIDPDEIGRIYVPAIGIPADATLALEALRDALADHVAVDRRRLEELRHEYLAQSRLPATTAAATVTSSELAAALSDLVSERDDVVLVMDAPSLGVWVQRYVAVDRPGAIRASAGGTMAWGFPAAMGMALARPEQRVVAVSGDGSFWMVAQDLETAVRENIPVVNVVANNFAFGNTRDRQRTAHDGRYLGVFYGNADLAAYAELLGAYGERVEKAEDLRPAIDRALASGRPAVIDVIQNHHEGLPPGLQPPAAR